MIVKDILNKEHTFLYTASGYTKGKYMQLKFPLKQILIDIPEQIKQSIFKLRAMGYGSTQYNETKKLFPCWVVSGVYPLRQINDNSTLIWSNIIAIDIDKKDNEDIDLDEVRKKLFDLPYVFAVLKSISGKGLYALVLVEEGQYTKEYYKYISKLWNQQYKLNIDTQCTNISRKRFIGYDEEAKKWIKDDNTEIEPWKLKYIEKKVVKNKRDYMHVSKYANNNNELVTKAIWKLLNEGYSIDNMNTTPVTRYGVWYHIACDFHHFDDGLNMFIKFSNNSTKYNDKITDITKKYNNAKIETDFDNVAQKWCGICKHIYGSEWWKDS